MATHRNVDWREVGDLIAEILTASFASRGELESEARKRGTSFEALVAAAVTQAVRKKIESRSA